MSPERESGISIRDIDPQGVALLLDMIMELAEYEKLTHQVKVDAAAMTQALFGKNQVARALLLFHNDRPAGYCIYFYNFSTFWGRPGIYVEDIYVKPDFRRLGLGRAVFQLLGRRAREEGCARLEFAVLDWNEPALRFYESLGAETMPQWLVHRFEGESLERLGGEE